MTHGILDDSGHPYLVRMTRIIQIEVQEAVMQIEGSVALVTGANRGIGRAFTEELMNRGAKKVYAAVRDVATVTDPSLVPVRLDVTDADRVAALAGELEDVTLVVNNAGVGHAGFPLNASIDAARLELETNYLGVV